MEYQYLLWSTHKYHALVPGLGVGLEVNFPKNKEILPFNGLYFPNLVRQRDAETVTIVHTPAVIKVDGLRWVEFFNSEEVGRIDRPWRSGFLEETQLEALINRDPASEQNLEFYPKAFFKKVPTRPNEVKISFCQWVDLKDLQYYRICFRLAHRREFTDVKFARYGESHPFRFSGCVPGGQFINLRYDLSKVFKDVYFRVEYEKGCYANFVVKVQIEDGVICLSSRRLSEEDEVPAHLI